MRWLFAFLDRKVGADMTPEQIILVAVAAVIALVAIYLMIMRLAWSAIACLNEITRHERKVSDRPKVRYQARASSAPEATSLQVLMCTAILIGLLGAALLVGTAAGRMALEYVACGMCWCAPQ